MDPKSKTSSIKLFLTISRYPCILPLKFEWGNARIPIKSIIASTIFCTISLSIVLQITPFFVTSSEWYKSPDNRSTDKIIFGGYIWIFFIQRYLWQPMAILKTRKIRSLLESMSQLGLLGKESPSVFSPQFFILSIGSVVNACTMVTVIEKDLENVFESSGFKDWEILPLNIFIQAYLDIISWDVNIARVTTRVAQIFFCPYNLLNQIMDDVITNGTGNRLFITAWETNCFRAAAITLGNHSTGTPVTGKIMAHWTNIHCDAAFTVFISIFIFFHRSIRKALGKLEFHLVSEHAVNCPYCDTKIFRGQYYWDPLKRTRQLLKTLRDVNGFADQFVFTFITSSILILITAVHVLFVTLIRLSNVPPGELRGVVVKQTAAMVVIVLCVILKIVILIEVGQDIQNAGDHFKTTLSELGIVEMRKHHPSFGHSNCPFIKELRQVISFQTFEIRPSNFFSLD
ncbi:hypothetical protein Fcan01_27396 [Folsomia candida]|uniref:Uncharacterized protein n=1 Tax=Folsomia candida TaxID=158441 RepID=A0A226CXZ7_FOLCA|nr:hypothetical protein Fcan01_27396 [Folsomia candida]